MAKFGPISNPREYGYKRGDGGTVINTVSTLTLTQDLYTDFVTLSSGGKIFTNGYRIYSNGPVVCSGAGSIFNNGTPGADGVAAGAGAPAGHIGTLVSGHRGGDGGNAAVNGGAAAATDGSADFRFSGSPGVDGAGGVGGAGSTRAAGDALENNWSDSENGSRYQWDFALRGALVCLSAGGWVFPSGGGGGGGGGTNHATNRGGGGGAGGGGVYISAPRISLSDTFAIKAVGGHGGEGEANCSGGGGGQGGWVVLHTDSLTLAGSSQVTVTGGAGGTGTGTGVDGDDGGDGWVYIFSERGIQAFYHTAVAAPSTLPDSV